MTTAEQIERCRREQEKAQQWLDTAAPGDPERPICEMGMIDWLIEERLIDGRIPK